MLSFGALAIADHGLCSMATLIMAHKSGRPGFYFS